MPERGVGRSLPRGVLSVGAGLAVLGASTYGFLLLSARQVSPADFSGLSVLYVLVYTVAPGLFLPLEQEIGRAVADRRARELGIGRLLRAAYRVSAGVVLGLLVLGAVAGPFIVGPLFNGSWLLCAGLLLAVLGEGAAYVTRGVFAGSDRFGAYGAQLAVEGGLRFAVCAALALAGVGSVGPYGVLLGGAFGVAVLATVVRLPAARHAGPAPDRQELTRALGWMMAGSLLSQLVVNFGPVAVKLLTARDSPAAGEFLAGLVLARLPLFLFAAVQAALLPSMSAALARGALAQFRAILRRLLLVLAVLSAAMVVVMATVGPPVVQLFFGGRNRLARGDLVVLSIATGLYMLANVVANGLLALQRFALAAAGWGAGAAVLLAIMAMPGPLLSKVEFSFLGATIACVLAHALLLRSAIRTGRPEADHARPVIDVVGGP